MAKIEKENKTPDPVTLIDRIPSDNIDLDKLSLFCQKQLSHIRDDRQEWEDRKMQYLEILDNLVGFELGEAPFDGASNLHIPIVMEKTRATHARFFQALFSINPPYYIEPQEAIDAQRIKKIDSLMKWGLSRFINQYQGIEPVMDEALWDYSADGWCFLQLRWERKMRKAVVVEEEQIKPRGRPKNPTQNEDGTIDLKPQIKFKEVQKWEKVFEGPVLDHIQQEDVYFPGAYDIYNSPMVAIRTILTAHDLRFGAMTGYYDKDVVDFVLEKGREGRFGNYDDNADTIRSQKGYYQGVKISDRETTHVDEKETNDEFTIYQCYCTFDIDGDGFDEELVVWFHEQTRKVIRWTYLDRITKTGRRPIYKADYITRPGRPYGIGLKELLYNLNMEINIIHNQKVDYGTITNMPFFFYNASSSLQNQDIRLKPGQGVPVDDVGGILVPQMKSGTAFGFQEENLLYTIVSRVSGISDANLGVAPSPGDAVRSQGQLAALLSEGNAQLDISLRRLQRMLGLVYSDIHQMMVDKLPADFSHLVLGADDDPMIDGSTGLPIMQQLKSPRTEVAGRVNFQIKTNAAAGNKVLQQQQRMELANFLLNPINLQMGVVDLNNVYEINKAVLESSSEVDISRFITKPENIAKPLSLQDEIEHIRQGIMPEIPLNDNHAEKVQALQVWIQSPQVVQGLQLKTVHPNAPMLVAAAIAKHQQFLQIVMMQQQQMMQAQGGQAKEAMGILQQQMNQQGGQNGQQGSTPPPQGGDEGVEG